MTVGGVGTWVVEVATPGVAPATLHVRPIVAVTLSKICTEALAIEAIPRAAAAAAINFAFMNLSLNEQQVRRVYPSADDCRTDSGTITGRFTIATKSCHHCGRES